MLPPESLRARALEVAQGIHGSGRDYVVEGRGAATFSCGAHRHQVAFVVDVYEPVERWTVTVDGRDRVVNARREDGR